MEEPWKRFTSIFRKLLSPTAPNAESPSIQESPAAPESNPSPVSPANHPDYTPVSKADAISLLCLPTGDEQLDYLHIVLIDLIQHDLLGVVRRKGDAAVSYAALRYFATESGKKYVEEHFQIAIDELLERILGDNQ